MRDVAGEWRIGLESCVCVVYRSVEMHKEDEKKNNPTEQRGLKTEPKETLAKREEMRGNGHRKHLDGKSMILGGNRHVGRGRGNRSEGDGHFGRLRTVHVGFKLLRDISIISDIGDNPHTLTRSGVTPRGVMACELVVLRAGRGAWRI